MGRQVRMISNTVFQNDRMTVYAQDGAGDGVLGGTATVGDGIETDILHAKELARLGHAKPLGWSLDELDDAALEPHHQVSTLDLAADRAKRSKDAADAAKVAARDAARRAAVDQADAERLAAEQAGHDQAETARIAGERAASMAEAERIGVAAGRSTSGAALATDLPASAAVQASRADGATPHAVPATDAPIVPAVKATAKPAPTSV